MLEGNKKLPESILITTSSISTADPFSKFGCRRTATGKFDKDKEVPPLLLDIPPHHYRLANGLFATAGQSLQRCFIPVIGQKAVVAAFQSPYHVASERGVVAIELDCICLMVRLLVRLSRPTMVFPKE